ncbi:MAG: hypothetical protein M5U34_19320 [Chloroflexi bacterium]|nr:hypothetical protein [Chloroflexota bacterium]
MQREYGETAVVTPLSFLALSGWKLTTVPCCLGGEHMGETAVVTPNHIFPFQVGDRRLLFNLQIQNTA